MEAKRIEILALLHVGLKKVDIVKLLNVSLLMVRWVINHLKIMKASKIDLILADCRLFNRRIFKKPFKRIQHQK